MYSGSTIHRCIYHMKNLVVNKQHPKGGNQLGNIYILQIESNTESESVTLEFINVIPIYLSFTQVAQSKQRYYKCLLG